MCTGVESGLAKFKFSTSPSRSGSTEIIRIIAPPTSGMGSMSFTVKDGLNFTLSRFLEVPVGLEDPVSWRVIRCTRVRAAITIGTRKCSEKNRFRVGCDTEKFPHNH